MPYADPEKANARRRALRKDPARAEKLRADERARYALKMQDPAERAKLNARCRAVQQADPERTALWNRRSKLKKLYGITLEEYDALFASQDGLCAICHEEETNGREFLAVDHCHRTGRVRGLLCGSCNLALGKFQDSPALLRSAIKYLAR